MKMKKFDIIFMGSVNKFFGFMFKLEDQLKEEKRYFGQDVKKGIFIYFWQSYDEDILGVYKREFRFIYF